MSAGYIRPQPTRRASVLPNSAAENTLGGKGRQRVAKKVWEWSLRQVWTFVGPGSICPHSFSGSAFCSWFWDCLSCFGLPQPAHMITSVDHLKTMDPGRINATCFTFVRRHPLLRLSGLNWFSVKIVLELMPWKRGTCVTPTLKSPASWSRWDLFKNFVLTLTICCGGKCFVIQLIFLLCQHFCLLAKSDFCQPWLEEIRSGRLLLFCEYHHYLPLLQPRALTRMQIRPQW